MVRAFLALALVLCCEQFAAAQEITLNPPNITPGTISVDGGMSLPMGWTIVNPKVTVIVLQGAGGPNGNSGSGTANAGATVWNDGKTPAGPVIISNIPTGQYVMYAYINVKDNTGANRAISSPLRFVSVP